jgi:hypothetical protein
MSPLSTDVYLGHPNGGTDMKNREKQRHNRKIKEEMLKLKDSCGVIDPTPHEAVKGLIKQYQHKRHNRI